MGNRPFTMLAALIFAVMELLHIYRIFTQFQVILGSHVVPQGVSWIVVLVTGLLSVMLFREAKR